MNNILAKMYDEKGVVFQKDILEGLSRKFVANLDEYMSDVFKSAMGTLPDIINLTYNGYRRLTPLEDFYNNINSSNSKNTIDISRNHLYKVEYQFEYEGMIVNRILALPYVERGGYIKLSNANYALVPILSEYPISPTPSEVFIRLLRDKITIKKMERTILINDVVESRQVLFSKSYKLLDKVNEVIPVILYTFIKHGFMGTFEYMFNITPKVVYGPLASDNIYSEEYNIYTTCGIKPRILDVKSYQKHTIYILIKKGDVTPLVESVIASLIYSFDMAPQYAMGLQRVIGIKKTPSTTFDYSTIDKESLFWVTLLGKIIFKGRYTMDKVQTDMLEHIDILNGYLDLIVKEKLKDIGIRVDSFHELLNWAIVNFNTLIMKHDEHSSSIDNRYIDLPYYILFDLIVGTNKAFLEFKRSATKKYLTKKEVDRIFNKYLSTKKIFGIIKSSGTNLAVAPIDATGDNWYFKATSILEDQNRGDGVKRSKNNVLPNNTKTLRAEDIAFGSMLHILKKAPTPRYRINPNVNVDVNNGKIVVPDNMNRIVKALNPLLSNNEVATTNDNTNGDNHHV